MATESVKILIEAEDKATAALKKAVTEQEKAAAKAEVTRVRAEKQLAAERVELEKGAEAAAAFRLELEGLDSATAANIARQKELIKEQQKAKAEQEKLANVTGAKSTKAGTEFFGAVANLAGGNAIGSVAGQIAGLTEKTSQFGEVAKSGTAAANAFRVGLVGAAGVIGFQIGSAIGNVIFETERWNKELEKANEQLRKLETVRLAQLDQSFADFRAGLEFSGDVEGDVASRLGDINTEIANLEQSKKAATASIRELESMQSGWSDLFNPFADSSVVQDQTSVFDDLFGGTQQLIDAKTQSVAQDQASLDKLREQKTELERLVGIEAQRAAMAKDKAAQEQSKSFVESLRQELELLTAESEGTANAVKAMRGAGATGQEVEAEVLLNEIDLIKQKIELQKQEQEEKKRAAEEEKQRLKEIDKLQKDEAANLRSRITLITQGKEAQMTEDLMRKGLATDQAKAIAAGQAALDLAQERDALDRQGGKRADLQAFESRLLTRGSEVDPAKSTAENTSKTLKLTEDIKQILDETLRVLETPKPQPTQAANNIPVVVKA